MPPKSRSNRRGTATPADKPNPSTDEQSVIPGPARGSQRWPTTITVLLPPHISQLRRLMTLARLSAKEHRWYNAYSYALNFTGQRTSTQHFLLSVWPQASVEWTAQSDRIPDSYDSSQQGDDEALSNVHLTEQEGVIALPSPQAVTDQASTYLARLRPRKEKEAEEPQRPPDSTASTASRPESRENYPDHAVLMTCLKHPPTSQVKTGSPGSGQRQNKELPDDILFVECIHSIWELKRTNWDSPYDSLNNQRLAEETILETEVLKQLLQTAEGAFAQYRHQDVMHVFLGVGYWVQKCIMRSNNMPPADFDWDTARPEDLRKYIQESGEIFSLLNPFKTDYSYSFKSAWTRASNDAIKAANTFLSQQ